MEETGPSMMEINDEEEFGDEFYEKLEAPKFVDLTAPDRDRREHDDRYWFCSRVGCDQKHEEEMDPEAIYKNFVLRVMAARSPSIGLRKALCRKDSSKNMKCPQTVPAKSSKSRVSKLAMISSISQKMVDAKVKTISKQNATPNATAKPSAAVAKALTTPRNKNSRSNPATFRSIRNPKATTIAIPNNSVVAKALVFPSPKKTVKLKQSVELGTSMRKLCDGMKKLEITNTKQEILGPNKKPLPVEAPRKQRKGREIKSRVYDSLLSKTSKGQEAIKCLKRKSKGKESKLCSRPLPREGINNDSSDLEIEEKPKAVSLDVPCASGTSKDNKENGNPSGEKKIETVSDARSSGLTSLSNFEEINTGDNKAPESQDTTREANTDRGDDLETKTKSSSKQKEISKIKKSDGKENNKVAEPNRHENELTDSDDKENASASNDNRKLNPNADHFERKKHFGKQETFKTTQKVTKVSAKTPKDSSTTGVQGVKYRKPKPTNPKPFRLRTDERRILKEANMDRKLNVLTPSKDITMVPGVSGRTSQRKHQNAGQRNKKCIGQMECANQTLQDREVESDTKILKDETQGSGTSCSKTKGAVKPKSSTTHRRFTVSMFQKINPLASETDCSKEKAEQKSERSLRRTKSTLMKQPAVSQGIASGRKKRGSPAASRQLGVIMETSKPKEMGKPNESLLLQDRIR
ncbi:cylicin-2 isoform X2 [Carica papaya]|uniref:cylicin-2 isoform X2 n=1 Tax=Carica papaya TaxID=3649 RepID=UPI000B8C9711|nr:cylicin-2 isoform X2 [Carica papaya]